MLSMLGLIVTGVTVISVCQCSVARGHPVFIRTVPSQCVSEPQAKYSAIDARTNSDRCNSAQCLPVLSDPVLLNDW